MIPRLVQFQVAETYFSMKAGDTRLDAQTTAVWQVLMTGTNMPTAHHPLNTNLNGNQVKIRAGSLPQLRTECKLGRKPR